MLCETSVYVCMCACKGAARSAPDAQTNIMNRKKITVKPTKTNITISTDRF